MLKLCIPIFCTFLIFISVKSDTIRAPSAFTNLVKKSLLSFDRFGGVFTLGSNEISDLKITGSDFKDLYFDSTSTNEMIISVATLSLSMGFRYKIEERAGFITYRDSGSGNGFGSGSIHVVFGEGTSVQCDATQASFELRLFSERSRLRGFLTNTFLQLRQDQISELIQNNICTKVVEQVQKIIGDGNNTLPIAIDPFNPLSTITSYIDALGTSIETRLEAKYEEYSVPLDMKKVRAPFQKAASTFITGVSSAIDCTATAFGDVGIVIKPLGNLFTTLANNLRLKTQTNDEQSIIASNKEVLDSIESVGIAIQGSQVVIPKYVGQLVADSFDVSAFGGQEALRPFVDVLEEFGKYFSSVIGIDDNAVSKPNGVFANIGKEIIAALNNQGQDTSDDWE